MSESPFEPPVTTPSAGGAASEEEIHLVEYWRILMERRGVVLACLTLTVVAGLLITFLATPQYLASTTLQIGRQGPEILTFKDVLDVDPAGYKDFYQTQYKIIQSRTVLRLAVGRLDLINQPEFLARKGSPLTRFRDWAGALLSGEELDEDPLTKAVEFIDEGLSVTPIRNSQLVTVSFMDRDAKFARDVANAVAEAYQQFSLESRSTATDQASEFLTKEVSRLQAEIAELELQLQDSSNDRAILALNDGTQDISEKALGDLNTRLTEAMGRQALAAARNDKISSASPEALPEVLASPLIGHLKEQYAEVERRYSQARERFKPGWPALAELEEEQRQARSRLDAEILALAEQVRRVTQREYEQAILEVANLKQQVEAQKQEVRRVHRDVIEFSGLRDEIETRRTVLSSLVARQSETEASGQLRDTPASNIRVVDRAETPERPARPRRALNLLLSVALGLGLGLGMAMLLYYVDNTIKTEQDLQRYGGGITVLGHVPLFQPLSVLPGSDSKASGKTAPTDTPPNSDLACHESPQSSFAEAFKSLRTSMLLASPDHPPRNIHVTSCEPSEGKSTTAINLAIALTQMGLKVLLVDADLRRPRIHTALRLANDAGLSNYLTGNAVPDELFRDTGIPGLSAVTSGPTPPNPSELLGAAGMDAFLRYLTESARFDHIIVDSPPVIQVADGLILANKTEATILVVKSGKTPRESLTQGVAQLRQARARLLGCVLNSVSEESRYYSRRYGYYYRQADSSGNSEPGRGWSAISRKIGRNRERRAG